MQSNRTIQYNAIQYNTIRYNTIQYNTIQYNTIQYNTLFFEFGDLANQNDEILYRAMQIAVKTAVCALPNSTVFHNTIQYNAICGENDTSLALIGQCNQIEHYNTIQYNVINTIAEKMTLVSL